MRGDGMTRINVTQHHIDDAQRYRATLDLLTTTCPVALAAKDAGIVYPQVSMDVLRYRPGVGSISDTKRVPLPQEAKEFVQRFDNSEHVEPFTFSVDIEGGTA